jgi:hypothetical protein
MNYESKTIPVKYDNGTTGEMEIKFPVKEKDKVYIVGCAGTKDAVPWNDKDAEFWGVNNLYGVDLNGAHYDRWFEIHNLWQDKAGKLLRRGSPDFRGQPVLNYMQGLAKIGCSIYMQKHWINLIPLSVPYPINEVIQFFSEKGITLDICRYITNTISYEIALAIYLGFKEIQVYGVDMAVGTEYENQRPSCEFWLGVAAGLGIKIVIPSQADLLKCRFMYGFEERLQDVWNEKCEKIRIDLKQKRIKLEQRITEDSRAVQQYVGGEHVLSEIRKIWGNLNDDLLFQQRGTL